jgi:hypothetical protein
VGADHEKPVPTEDIAKAVDESRAEREAELDLRFLASRSMPRYGELRWNENENGWELLYRMVETDRVKPTEV